MFLYVSQRKAYSRIILEELTKTGAFLFLTSTDTAVFFCKEKETGGVILDCVRDLQECAHICEELRSLYPTIPIAAIVAGQTVPDLRVDTVVRDVGDPNALAEQLRPFLCHVCGWEVQALSTYTLTLHADPAQPAYYMGSHLPLSPKENRLLYCLLYRAPRQTSTDDLLELCYHGEPCSLANLNTLVRRINHRAMQIFPRPLIIRENGFFRLRRGIVWE